MPAQKLNPLESLILLISNSGSDLSLCKGLGYRNTKNRVCNLLIYLRLSIKGLTRLNPNFSVSVNTEEFT